MFPLFTPQSISQLYFVHVDLDAQKIILTW